MKCKKQNPECGCIIKQQTEGVYLQFADCASHLNGNVLDNTCESRKLLSESVDLSIKHRTKDSNNCLPNENNCNITFSCKKRLIDFPDCIPEQRTKNKHNSCKCKNRIPGCARTFIKRNTNNYKIKDRLPSCAQCFHKQKNNTSQKFKSYGHKIPDPDQFIIQQNQGSSHSHINESNQNITSECVGCFNKQQTNSKQDISFESKKINPCQSLSNLQTKDTSISHPGENKQNKSCEYKILDSEQFSNQQNNGKSNPHIDENNENRSSECVGRSIKQHTNNEKHIRFQCTKLNLNQCILQTTRKSTSICDLNKNKKRFYYGCKKQCVRSTTQRNKGRSYYHRNENKQKICQFCKKGYPECICFIDQRDRCGSYYHPNKNKQKICQFCITGYPKCICFIDQYSKGTNSSFINKTKQNKYCACKNFVTHRTTCGYLCSTLLSSHFEVCHFCQTGFSSWYYFCGMFDLDSMDYRTVHF